MRALLALSLLPLAAAPAEAQDRATAIAAPQSGADALERLKAARDGQANTTTPRGPSSLPVPTQAQRKRAFEGLRRRQPAPAMDARARAALDKARAGLATEREAMARRIGEALGLELPDIKTIASAVAPSPDRAWVPLLFASSSMPTSTLRAYAAQLERARGVIAFRGMPGGLTKVAPMARLTAEMLRLDPGCEGPACAMRGVQVIVDPLLFRQHGVTRVPAITMVPGDPTQPYCEREGDSPRGSHLVLGDAALSGLLEEYARLGGKTEISDALTRLESR
jgi:type-F conjugative transfer system pilin assembly protein TrbC